VCLLGSLGQRLLQGLGAGGQPRRSPPTGEGRVDPSISEAAGMGRLAPLSAPTRLAEGFAGPVGVTLATRPPRTIVGTLWT
jgi:hypothetical protein